MTEEDKSRIDAMDLWEMDRVFKQTASFSWPFKDGDTGDYFCERYERLRNERADHLADPN